MLTLVEAYKLSKDPVASAIMETYANATELFSVLPIADIPGGAMVYNQEGVLPGVGFRGVNEAYTESTGVLNPQVDTLSIAGGDLDVDKFIVQTRGASARAVQEMMKAKALSLALARAFIKGDPSTNAREFWGLQERLINNQLIWGNAVDGGAALSLAVVDRAVDQVDNPTHIVMSKAMKRRFTQAMRTAAVAGNIHQERNDFGKIATFYNELPIIALGEDNNGNDIIGFNELNMSAATFNNATTSSIYVVSFGPEGVTAFQNGGMQVTDLGELQAQPVYRTRIEWYMGLAVMGGKSAARIGAISNAAIVA